MLSCCVRTVIARLAMEQYHLFKLHVDFPAIVTDCRGNVTKAFNNTLQWDGLHSRCHLLYNVVKVGLDALKNNVANCAQATAALV